MKIIHKDNKLELIVNEGLLKRLGELAVHHYPKEFGGFLVGNYSDDRKALSVTDYILPRSYANSSVIFERSVEGIEGEFETLYKERGIYYVGEWHSHPNGSTKNSGTDLTAMINTAACETVQIMNPILLILSVDKNRMTGYTFYYFDADSLTPYE